MTAQRCHSTNRDGSPCNAYAVKGSDCCFHHDPHRAVERRRARSQGGRARHGRRIGPHHPDQPIALKTIKDVATLLQHTIGETLLLENSLHRARTVGYLAGHLIKALDIAALEERIARLEQILNSREEGS